MSSGRSLPTTGTGSLALAVTSVPQPGKRPGRTRSSSTLDRPDRIGPHSRFGIASDTKAHTAVAFAILVDEGKLGWDDPVMDHLL